MSDELVQRAWAVIVQRVDSLEDSDEQRAAFDGVVAYYEETIENLRDTMAMASGMLDGVYDETGSVAQARFILDVDGEADDDE
jgi:hypothetical protein